MKTPMIDRAFSQLYKQYPPRTPAEVMDEFSDSVEISKEAVNKSSRTALIHSIIRGLECLLEDTPSPDCPKIIAAIEAVKAIP